MTFDMQKARQAAVELVGRTQLPLPDRLDREQRALGLFPAALDEIERLQADKAQLHEQLTLKIRSCDAIPLMHAKDEEIGRLEGKLKLVSGLVDRIAELEAVLAEERAKDGAKMPELCDIVHDELMCPVLDGDCEHWEGCPRKDELRQKAREQLISEGKIGSSDHIREATNMMLTPEQRAALDFAVRWLDDDPCEFLLSPVGKGHRDTLRSLLSLPPVWEVTEERKAAISDALDILDGKSDCMRHFVPDVLRSMIEEARP